VCRTVCFRGKASGCGEQGLRKDAQLGGDIVDLGGCWFVLWVDAAHRNFRNPHADGPPQTIELARSTEAEKQSQLARLADFHTRHAAEAPAMLARLQQAVIANANVFDVLMDAVRCCSLGQITNALFEVGGQYRRSM
jgi:hypothetical protein